MIFHTGHEKQYLLVRSCVPASFLMKKNLDVRCWISTVNDSVNQKGLDIETHTHKRGFVLSSTSLNAGVYGLRCETVKCTLG